MAQTQLTWDGLAEFRSELQAFPQKLDREGATQVRAQAEAARSEIRAGYVVRSGTLANSLQPVRYSDDGLSARLVNTAPYAAAYEYGSAVRHTSKGFNRGRVDAHHSLVPVAMRRRRALVSGLTDYLQQQGLQTSGGL